MNTSTAAIAGERIESAYAEDEASDGKACDAAPAMPQEFLDAYVECALWSSTEGENGEIQLDEYDGDIAPDSIESMRADCRDFWQANYTDIAQCRSIEQAGHDFWLTRNHHGAGFWDRGLGEVGKRLSNAAHAYGSCDLYIGDDGAIHATA